MIWYDLLFGSCHISRFSDLCRKLEKNWKVIRDEAVSLLDARGEGGFQNEAERLQNTGDWKQLTLYHQGRRDHAGCRRAPKTCEIISGMNDAIGCSRGQV